MGGLLAHFVPVWYPGYKLTALWRAASEQQGYRSLKYAKIEFQSIYRNTSPRSSLKTEADPRAFLF